MPRMQIIPLPEFERVRDGGMEPTKMLALIADMCRANALTSVKVAGSGHLGSSFSAMDIVVSLYYREMNVAELGPDDPDRDIYFSSKGHDVPGLYAVLHSLGILPEGKLLKLRRLGGLCGHPDVSTTGVEANSGSLGMGISKGRGMALGKRMAGRSGRVFVLTGDGELQEGQIYESLQRAVSAGETNLTVIVDHNKVQSDKLVAEISDLGDIEAKFRAFGWHVARCDGHDFTRLADAFAEFRTVTDKPCILVADTIKGRGVSFMEHPAALEAGGGLYRWHSGAPDDESYAAGHAEIIARVNGGLASFGLDPLRLVEAKTEKKKASGVSHEYVAQAYGEALADLAARHDDLVVLDADLSADCRLRTFETTYPDRFIENGIAEQDMASVAGGLALQGLLPVVNSFGSFLASRSNEQIYNNACERTRIIYVCHYAGVIPAGPGQSHQSIRDISLFGALPNCVILQPCNAVETKMAVAYCVEEASDNCMLRLVIGPSPRIVALPPGYRLTFGKGVALTEGDDAILFGYGPVMLHEALEASEILGKEGVGLKVVNLPWLNRTDTSWLQETLVPYERIFVLEDHAPVGGLGDHLLHVLAEADLLRGKRFRTFGVEGYPEFGNPPEVLRFHRLDGASLADRIRPGVASK